MPKKGILERLKDGIVIGDGGFVIALEKRGYIRAGFWTPEVTVEHPDAVKQLHREFLRAGSDVCQAFTFYATEDRIKKVHGEKHSSLQINQEGCKLAKMVADEGGALFLGSISQTPTYANGEGKEAVQDNFRKQIKVLIDNGVDFLLCEFFEHIEEIEWAIEVCKESGKPVASTMCISPIGNIYGKNCGECAVRMAKAGADIVGLNCHFDPFMVLDGIRQMKDALDKENLKAYLMTQPLGYMTADCNKLGYLELPEYPFGLETRTCTRWEIQKYAREAYNIGVRYIGGCCGFEPYHIRAISEELENERGGKVCEASEKHGKWGSALAMHTKPWVRNRAKKEYWENLEPSTGRPFSAAKSVPYNWNLKKGEEK